jgi:phosphatidylglycerophosphate synthase
MALLADNIFEGPCMKTPSPAPLMRDAGLHLVLFGGALTAALLASSAAGVLGWRGATTSALVYVAMAGLVLAGLARHPHPDRFGLANAITLARAAITALMFGVAGEWLLGGMVALTAGLRWTLAGAATIILLLDGLDGPAARRSGMASPFGARFDMEADALFVLALCMVTAASGAVGLWLMASASLRYLFLAASRLEPRLAAPLPPLLRRKAIYVVQAAAPIITLIPFCPARVGWALCATAFALVAYSFATDSLWLLARGDGGSAHRLPGFGGAEPHGLP